MKRLCPPRRAPALRRKGPNTRQCAPRKVQVCRARLGDFQGALVSNLADRGHPRACSYPRHGRLCASTADERDARGAPRSGWRGRPSRRCPARRDAARRARTALARTIARRDAWRPWRLIRAGALAAPALDFACGVSSAALPVRAERCSRETAPALRRDAACRSRLLRAAHERRLSALLAPHAAGRGARRRR